MKAHKGPLAANESCPAASASASGPASGPESGPASAPQADDLQTLLQRPLPTPTLPTNAAANSGVRIGHVVQVGVAFEEGVGSAAGLLVLLPGEEEPVPALALCPLTAQDVGRPCAVLFVDGDPQRPLVVGCVVAGVEADVEATEQYAPREVSAPLLQDKPEVVVDGEVVRIEAQRELELRCGESVILLQSNGRIEIRGNYVTSQATATQRLRGGSVHIN